jgi:uncharacterized protein (DUF1778 family)
MEKLSMPRTQSLIKNEQIAFRATNDLKSRIRKAAEYVGMTDGEFCREAAKELEQAIYTNPQAAELLRARAA